MEFQRTRRIASVKFAGINALSSNDTQSVFAVKSGDIFDQQNLIEAGEKLRQLYFERGFLNAVVDIEMPPETENSVGVVVKVTENKQTLIHNVYLQSSNEGLNQDLRQGFGVVFK